MDYHINLFLKETYPLISLNEPSFSQYLSNVLDFIVCWMASLRKVDNVSGIQFD